MITVQKYFKPKSIENAIELAHFHSQNFCFLAGGTDLIVNKFQGNEEAKCLIDLSGIDELKTVSTKKDFLKIGSLVTLNDLKNCTEIKNEFPVLIETAESVASPVIRKTATIGGNLLCENRCIFYNQTEWWRKAAGNCLKCDGDVCIATGGKKKCFSKFVSDVAVTLISLDANIEIIENNESIFLPLEDIYTGNGIEPRNLKKNAIIKSIFLPLNQNFQSAFYKLRQRESIDFTSLSACISGNNSGNIKIVLGGVDTKPIVVKGKKGDDINSLIKQSIKKSRIVDNDFFSRDYRKNMISVFIKRSFEKLLL